LGLTAQINLEMKGSGPGALTLDNLTVGPGLASLHIDSESSGATGNVITDFSNVADSVTVTGGTHLTLGDTAGHAYALATGTIDASGTTGAGGVSADLAPTFGNPTGQTFIAGTAATTTNLANVFTPGGGLINFSGGGTDTVQFHATQTAASLLNDATNHHFNVVTFGTGTDAVNISVGAGGIPLNYTDTGAAVAAGDPTLSTAFTGSNLNLSAAPNHFNYINFTNTAQNFTGDTAAGAFASAIGANTIQVNGIHDFLLSFYDAATSQAVLVSAASHLVGLVDEINNASAITVVGLIHETAAQYGTLPANTHFVA
jgi:hypothetical protein